MIISVIVCTRDRPGLIGGCLEALSASRTENMEVLVVDQSSGSQTAEVVAAAAREDSRIRHLRTSTTGLSRARNIGIERSTGDIISFTDDDCAPGPDWPSAMITEFEGYSSVSGIFGKCLPDEPPRPGERPVGVKTDETRRVFSGRNNPWRLGHGSNMAYRREVFEKIGGFDEMLGPGAKLKNCDDADFAYRALKAGFALMYSPEPMIRHRQFRHGEDLWRLEKEYDLGAGALYSKHLRCGDAYTLLLIAHRWINVGATHLVYGMLTAKREQVRLGWYRIVYSAAGLWAARKYSIDTAREVFRLPPVGDHYEGWQSTGIGDNLHP